MTVERLKEIEFNSQLTRPICPGWMVERHC